MSSSIKNTLYYENENESLVRFEAFEPLKHYEEICKWWLNEKFDPIPLSHLPTNGIVVYSKDKMACAAWIYKTDSAFCILDWYVANPEIRKKERSNCLDYLIEVAKKTSTTMGFSSIFTTTNHSSLMSRLEKNDFSVMSKNMNNLILNLKGF